ncbi:MAG: hypothetical protein ABL962_09935, partial [Fimbriimonadaceae bacterium]
GVYGFSPAGTGVVGISTVGHGIHGLSSTASGVRGESDSGYGVYGMASGTSGANYGVHGQSASTSGVGVNGIASSTTGNSFGVQGQSASAAGAGVYGIGYFGVRGLSTSSSGLGVSGSANSPTGLTFGVNGHSASATGVGVNGSASSTSGINYGVYGRSASPSGYGLFSDGNAEVSGRFQVRKDLLLAGPLSRHHNVPDNIGPVSPAARIAIHSLSYDPGGTTAIGIFAVGDSFGATSYGVLGNANGAAVNYGVYGTAVSGTTNYAGYFDGLLFANAASAGVKAFMIDHPMDPANKVLMHSSIEGEERMNLYRGVVKTDALGYAVVTMPNYFDALNEDIQYQVSVIDEADSADFVLAKVVQKLRNGKFKIRTSVPGAEVHWQVSGRRHDPTSNYYPLVVERMKNKDEKGKYYVPEAYGKDKSLGMGYLPMRETSGTSKK